MQEGAPSALLNWTTRRDGRRESPPLSFRAFHARHAVEIRSGKNDRLFPQEHEWGGRASARSDRAPRKRPRLPRVAVAGQRAAPPAARHAESTSPNRIRSRWQRVSFLDNLPEPRQSAATIKIGGRVFTVSEIDRLYHAKNK